MNIKSITERLIKFRDDRDWQKFHTGKELARALSIEVSELNELFLWDKRICPDQQGIIDFEDEMADCQIYLLYLAEKYGTDLEGAVLRKIDKNAIKYPVKP